MLESVITVGARVQDSNSDERGTVMYVGPVHGTQGQWIGVDWDSSARGKHNGTYHGKAYFTSRSPTSGSFVRASKLLTGVDLETAVRGKYQAPPPDTTSVEEMLQHVFKARFVQFVGMDKISEKQSALQTLQLIELKDCLVSSAGFTRLDCLLPRIVHLDLTGSLLTDWQTVANIVVQLPKLKILNLSDNRLTLPDQPEEMRPQFSRVSHLVLNNMRPAHTWLQLCACAAMFDNLNTFQVAFNNMTQLGPVPSGVLSRVESLDVGANPISDCQELLHLHHLPRLTELNVNNCQLPVIEYPVTDQPLFPQLTSLYLANNPLDKWRTICQLSKLPRLENLALSFKLRPEDYFNEFTYAVIRSLKMLNRAAVTPKEKRDYELFYLKTFGKDYYEAGGHENPEQAVLTPEFVEQHPTYLQLVREVGAPYDERKSEEQRLGKSRLRDQKLLVTMLCDDGRSAEQELLPTLKISRLKMGLKRSFKLPGTAKLSLSYRPAQRPEQVIYLDSDHRDIAYYSISSGDIINVSWT